ncbi:MAG: hypothetical protein HY360_15035 [Verrucomicrobia bacterium]|nr:hypothetical protein [Verrucomicrobiota bacterium]
MQGMFIRLQTHHRWFILAAILLLQGEGVRAQQDLQHSTAGDLTKFIIPERNREGVLIWQLTGDHATVRADGKMRIETLRVSTFRNAQVDWTLFTPNCVLDREAREAVSEASVRIANKETEITGVGFHWLANESRLIVRSRVQVVVMGGLAKAQSL